jgi:hypothetical protein
MGMDGRRNRRRVVRHEPGPRSVKAKADAYLGRVAVLSESETVGATLSFRRRFQCRSKMLLQPIGHLN